MFQPTRLLMLALLFGSTSLCAAPAAEKQKTPATAKSTPEAGDDAPDTTPAPTKIDLGAQKFWEALKLLDSKEASVNTKGREALQAAADLEYPHAQTVLAECLMTGQNGFSKDKRKAANLYRLAAERGNAFAQVSLGQCLYSGTGIRKDREKAAAWLAAALEEKADYSRPTPPADYLAETAKKTAKSDTVAGELDRDPVGDCQASAHYLLGVIASTDKKPDIAQKHFVQAATAGIDGRSGIYPAAVQAALNYAFGQGTPRDMTKANDMLATSRKLTVRAGVRMIHNYATLKVVDDFATADLEDTLAAEGEKFQTNTQFEIANTFTDKKSKDYNPAEAIKWYELAAENGNIWAMLKLALLYSGNELGQPNPVKAFTWFEKAGGGEKPKHYLGTANLAICHFNGIGTPKDVEKATTLFKKFKKDDFVCYLGSIGQCPPSILTWEQRLALIETWAKDKKDPQAQYTLGKRYRDGWDAKPDPKAAIRWFKKATTTGHGASWTELGMLHESNYALFAETQSDGQEAAVNCYKQATEAREPYGMANYANMLNRGCGVKRDNLEAERIYLRCLEIDPDFARAHNNLANIYESRISKFSIKTTSIEHDTTYNITTFSSGMDDAEFTVTYRNNDAQDVAVMLKKLMPDLTALDGAKTAPPTDQEQSEIRNKMLVHYEAAYRLKFAFAARNLGRLYHKGSLVPQDYRKAYQCYEKSTEWGLTEDHRRLAEMHKLGQGVPITFTEAAYHYRLAALEGDTDSLKNLIELYLSGKLGEADLDRARFWLDRMLTQGDSSGITTSIDIIIQKKEYATALKWLYFLEENGSKSEIGFACDRLNTCYEKGLGVKANPAKAKKYLDRAVANKNGDAIAWRGMLLMKEGKFQEGIAAFQQASTSSAKACFYLGQLYFFGTHVEKDRPRALKLMSQAAADNNPDALTFLVGATCNNIQGAPDIDEAIRMANQAEALGIAKAKALREMLEKRRDQKNEILPEETARARSS